MEELQQTSYYMQEWCNMEGVWGNYTPKDHKKSIYSAKTRSLVAYLAIAESMEVATLPSFLT